MRHFWDEPENVGWQNLAARLEEQTRFFWAIDSISSALNSTITTEDMLDVALERGAELTGATSGGVYVPRLDGTWRAAVVYVVPESRGTQFHESTGETIIQQVLESGGPVVHRERLNEPPRQIPQAVKGEGMQSVVACAVLALGRPLAVIVLTSRDYDAFGGPHLELLRVISQMLGLSLSNTLVHERALLQADTEYQRQMAEMEAVLASMPDGLIICDGRGEIVRANRSAGKILGTTAGALVGRSVLGKEWNNIHPRDEGDTQQRDEWPLRRVIEAGDECRNVPIIWEVRGQPRTISLTASPVQQSGGKREGAVIVVRDITEEHHAEAMKEEFLSLLSHELRGPLTVVSGYAQMLTRRLRTAGMEQEVTYSALIRENAMRMSAMVGDLVDSSRLESGMQAIRREPADLPALAVRVAARISTEQSHAANFHSIEVDAEEDLPDVEIDPRRIDQVLTNLITNAIKYSPEGGPVSVRVARTPPDRLAGGDATTRELSPNSLIVTVSDQGAGVPPQDRIRVFDRAYRGELGKSISAQGLGLGLYISRLAVEAHGGRIGVEEGPGGVGSTFWFTLPLQ